MKDIFNSMKPQATRYQAKPVRPRRGVHQLNATYKGTQERQRCDAWFRVDPVASSEPFEEKMARLTKELSAQFAESKKLEEKIRKNLEGLGFAV